MGVQGAGKSLSAKAIASSWQVPLFRMDFGALFDKFQGESERKLREALRVAEAMQPCVLWMDEVEKGLSSGSGDGDSGAGQRMLGTLLTWMAERRSSVFLVATANDIDSLPPELRPPSTEAAAAACAPAMPRAESVAMPTPSAPNWLAIATDIFSAV